LFDEKVKMKYINTNNQVLPEQEMLDKDDGTRVASHQTF